MIRVKLEELEKSQMSILCIGAHSDDIEIGCGGSIMRLIDQHPDSQVYWVVLSASKHRENEALTSAELFLEKAKRKKIAIKNFRDSFFPYIGGDIKTYFEEIKRSISPDIIFTHWRDDLHQDHRLVSELTWNTFRNHLIFEYEIIKYDGDLGSPNVFFHLSQDECMRKIQYIMKVFKTQGERSWFTEDAFMAIMRVRGIESNSPYKYAEGFYCKKLAF